MYPSRYIIILLFISSVNACASTECVTQSKGYLTARSLAIHSINSLDGSINGDWLIDIEARDKIGYPAAYEYFKVSGATLQGDLEARHILEPMILIRKEISYLYISFVKKNTLVYATLFDNLTALELDAPEGIPSGDLAVLRLLPCLRSLNLDSLTIPRGELKYLADVVSLRELSLTNAKVSDSDVSELQGLRPDLLIKR